MSAAASLLAAGLGHAARIRRLPQVDGRPVPYVTAWSTEGRFVTRHWGQSIALDTTGRLGQGRPAWSVMHPGRQRRCVTEGLCQVCLADLNTTGGWVPNFPEIAAGTRPHPTIPGEQQPLLDLPPACWPCVHFALAACPVVERAAPVDLIHVTRLDPYAIPVTASTPGPLDLRYADQFDAVDPPERRSELLSRRPTGYLAYAVLAGANATPWEPT